MGRLTVTMIVRNEERNLPGCLEAIRTLGSVVSEVCIYDTGSSDHTVEVARSWGARVDLGYWDDDFARARNASLAMSKTPWVLILDADDRIVSSGEALNACMDSAESRPDSPWWGVAMPVDDVRGERVVGSTPGGRILQSSTMHYRNRLHEVVVAKDGRTRIRWVGIAHSLAHIRHVGYADTSNDRAERNLRLSVRAVEESRASGDMGRLAEALSQLGRSRQLSGDLEGAMNEWRAVRKLPTTSVYRRYASELLAEALIESGDGESALPLLEAMTADGGHDVDLLGWLRARALHQQGRVQEALSALRAVEEPTFTFLSMKPKAHVLLMRARLAEQLGHEAEVVSALIGLASDANPPAGVVPALLRRWAERPPEHLARVLAGAGADAQRLSHDFAALGSKGEVVARALLADTRSSPEGTFQ